MYRKIVVLVLAAVFGFSTCLTAQEVAEKNTQKNTNASQQNANNQAPVKKKGGKRRTDTVARIHKSILEVQVGLKNESLSQQNRRRLDKLMGSALESIKADKLWSAEKQLSAAIVIIYPERAEEIEAAAQQRLAERIADRKAQEERQKLAEAQERELYQAAEREKQMAAKREAEAREQKEAIERQTVETAEIEKAKQVQLGVEHEGFVENAARDEVEKALLQEMMAKAHAEELKAADVEARIRAIEQAKAIEKAEQAIRDFEVSESTESVQRATHQEDVAKSNNGRDGNPGNDAQTKNRRETSLREEKVKLPAEVQTKLAELEEAAKAMEKIGKSEIAAGLRDEAAEMLRVAEKAAKQNAVKRSPGKNAGKKNINKQDGVKEDETPSAKDTESTIDIESLEEALNNVQKELKISDEATVEQK